MQSLSPVQLFATHGLQHARLPCPSPTPGAYSDSCPWSRWCHPTISSSVVPSPPAFDLSQHQALWLLIKLGIIMSQPSRALVRIRWINGCQTLSTISDTQLKCIKWWSCYNYSSFICLHVLKQTNTSKESSKMTILLIMLWFPFSIWSFFFFLIIDLNIYCLNFT